MAQPRKFKSDTGVSIYVPDRPDPIRVNAGEPYETENKSEIEALEGSSEVIEVKSKEQSKEAEKSDSREQQQQQRQR